MYEYQFKDYIDYCEIVLHVLSTTVYSLFGSKALSRFFSWVLRFNVRKPHPPIALHVKYRCVGVYSSFNFRVITTLPSKNAKFCTPQKFPTIRYIIKPQECTPDSTQYSRLSLFRLSEERPPRYTGHLA